MFIFYFFQATHQSDMRIRRALEKAKMSSEDEVDGEHSNKISTLN
jgi:hypothetical protein